MNKRSKKNTNRANGGTRREQPRKDSRSKRVNLDNERVGKFVKDEEKVADGSVTGKCNDPVWYAHNPQLLQAAANLPFSTTVGQPIPNSSGSVPGVMSFHWYPYVGSGFGAPVNQAANSVYSFTVHANSRNQSYDAPDEMMLILAGASLFSFIALGIRAYGLMGNYSQLDRYTPDALLAASGFDPADLRANYSHMLFDLNNLIAQSKQVWVPADMPVFQRWFWLNSNIYKDAGSLKAQYYVFAPTVVLQWDVAPSPNGASCLTAIPWMNYKTVIASSDQALEVTLKTWEEYRTIAQSLIDALVNSQDRGIIFGDILKAYGAERLFSIKPLDWQYTVSPVYDSEVLTQIENATFWHYNPSDQYVGPELLKPGIYQRPTDSRIFQVVRYLVDSSVVGKSSIGEMAPNTQVLNFHQTETPTPSQIMVATRLKSSGYMATASGSIGSSSGHSYAPAHCGTEFLTDSFIVQYGGSQHVIRMYANPAVYPQSGTNISLIKYFLYNSFDWCPSIYASSTYTVPDTITLDQAIDRPFSLAVVDFDNYTFVSVKDLDIMNTTAVYSEFGVPVLQ